MIDTPEINKQQALLLHDGICNYPYLVLKPKSSIEHTNFTGKKFYTQSCWQCLSCKWESETIIKRTI